MKLPMMKDIPPNTTVSQLADKLHPGVTYDTALPQLWVDTMLNIYGVDVRGQVVWGYPEGNVWGVPLPLTQEMKETLGEMKCY